jgi:hypothetical protein
MEGKLEIFGYLLVEEFLMRKNLLNTLDQFREEWISRPDEVSEQPSDLTSQSHPSRSQRIYPGWILL